MFYFLLVVLYSAHDLRSSIRDQIHASSTGSAESTTGPPEKSFFFFLKQKSAFITNKCLLSELNNYFVIKFFCNY